MAIVLFTDFGSGDLYVGQVELAILRATPDARIVHLLHDAPAFAIEASAHLLAALSTQIPPGNTVVAVVDPGVGSARRAAIIRADERWFVGPDNGLLSIIVARSSRSTIWHVREVPASSSPTFHGRDVFAPIAAQLAAGRFPDEQVALSSRLDVQWSDADLDAIIYFDHYGNAFSGIRGTNLAITARLRVAGHVLRHARTFADVAAGEPFWYVNSQGLVEIAVNVGRARDALNLSLGMPVAVEH